MADMDVAWSDDRLICGICLEDFKKPKILPCYHTFCTICLEIFIEKYRTRNQLYCPLCRTIIVVPGKGIEGFQTNYYIKRERISSEEPIVSCVNLRNKSKNVLSPDKLTHVKTIKIPDNSSTASIYTSQKSYTHISGIAPVGNGKAWISSFLFKQLKFIDIENDIITTFDLGNLGESVTVNSKSEAISARQDDKTVKLVKLDSGQETIISSLAMVPHGVCCYTTDDGTEELLLACTNSTGYDGNQGQVYRYDTEECTLQPAKIEGFVAPTCIAVEPKTKMMCIGDCRNHTVTIHDPSGKLFVRYKDSRCRPVGVQFYDDQRILVVNYRSDIRVIRIDGTLETVLKQTPCYSVAVDLDDNLWVGTASDVQVFKIK